MRSLVDAAAKYRAAQAWYTEARSRLEENRRVEEQLASESHEAMMAYNKAATELHQAALDAYEPR